MILQGGLTVGHRAHNPKIGGSIPPPARISIDILIHATSNSTRWRLILFHMT